LRRRPWVRLVIISCLGILTLFTGATLRLLVFPKTDTLSKADAIFMLDGATDRRPKALELARAGYAPTLVVAHSAARPCPSEYEIPGVKLICFRPDPPTTQGEAREAGRLAKQYGWKKMIFVVERPQNTRARLRIGRCYDGETLVTTVNPPTGEWPYQIAYQWGAMAKALIWQRGC